MYILDTIMILKQEEEEKLTLTKTQYENLFPASHNHTPNPPTSALLPPHTRQLAPDCDPCATCGRHGPHHMGPP